MAYLTLMCGIPGSGKSTWLKGLEKENAVISRDKIRYSLLNEGDAYFSKEKEVFELFTKQINDSLTKGINTYVDATHITPGSRRKLLNAITAPYDRLNAIVIDTPLEECLKRNAQRIGRACVPEDQVINMYEHFVKPTLNEGFNYIITETLNDLTIAKEKKDENLCNKRPSLIS